MPGLHFLEAVPEIRIALAGEKDALVACRDVHVVEKVVIQIMVLSDVLPAVIQALASPFEGLGDGGEGHRMAVVVGCLEDGGIRARVRYVPAEIQALVDS